MNKEERIFFYGHDLTVNDIQKLIPFTKVKIRKDFFEDPNYTVTFDAQLAYAFLRNAYKCLQWGCEYKGKTVFIFEHKRITINDLPF